MNELSPILYVFAGNNGSGKSTIRNLIIDRLGISVNIDPDALARSIDADQPESRKISAGKKAIKLARDCIENKRDFSVETTLAGGNAIRLMKEAKNKGFEVTMFYVGLGDYRLNIERVAARVRNGGHHIPTEDIIRRHSTSIKNLHLNLILIDYLIVIDNSEASGEIVLQAKNNVITHEVSHLPAWAKSIKETINKFASI
ncbi:zeta toxin family protein [Paenibacillus cellulositrophicus]|uniref:zeta toxin family protein n=1 Tax=Paenibacillus TaxID=44249 RepID=UPI00178BD20D|nr:zeta toxin family protein [Paenibacillus cellulositrophicus]MCM3001355.1 zeta toxin family protein [Paenibacillus cellulositrophicus]